MICDLLLLWQQIALSIILSAAIIQGLTVLMC